MQAAARSYPVDQLDRPVEESEGSDGDSYREEIGRKTATAGKDVSEREHISIMRPVASRVCVQSRETRGDFIKIWFCVLPASPGSHRRRSPPRQTERGRSAI